MTVQLYCIAFVLKGDVGLTGRDAEEAADSFVGAHCNGLPRKEGPKEQRSSFNPSHHLRYRTANAANHMRSFPLYIDVFTEQGHCLWHCPTWPCSVKVAAVTMSWMSAQSTTLCPGMDHRRRRPSREPLRNTRSSRGWKDTHDTARATHRRGVWA